MKESLPDSIAFLSVGSNLGDPAQNCITAIEWIAQSEAVKVLRQSSFYRTEPVGMADQPWFVNVVLEIRTTLDPRGLLNFLKSIEKKMGRQADRKWGPRVIDLDILFFGLMVIQDKDLQVPHPELHRRRFVLVPLLEIAPYTIHPVFGISVKGLMDRLQDVSKVEKIEMDAEYN